MASSDDRERAKAARKAARAERKGKQAGKPPAPECKCDHPTGFKCYVERSFDGTALFQQRKFGFDAMLEWQRGTMCTISEELDFGQVDDPPFVRQELDESISLLRQNLKQIDAGTTGIHPDIHYMHPDLFRNPPQKEATYTIKQEYWSTCRKCGSREKLGSYTITYRVYQHKVPPGTSIPPQKLGDMEAGAWYVITRKSGSPGGPWFPAIQELSA